MPPTQLPTNDCNNNLSATTMAEDLYRLQQTYLPQPSSLSIHNTNPSYSLQLQTLLEEENRRRNLHQLQLHDNVPTTDNKQERLTKWHQTQVDAMNEFIKQQQQQLQPRLVAEKENHNQQTRQLPQRMPLPTNLQLYNLQQTLLEKEKRNKSIYLLKHNDIKKRKKRKCTHDGCNSNALLAGGVCKKHGGKKYVYTCKLTGCTSQAKRGGLCGRHIRLREKEELMKKKSSTSSIEESIEEIIAPCTHEGCMNNQMENGLCIMHGIKLKKSKKKRKVDDGCVVLCPIIIN